MAMSVVRCFNVAAICALAVWHGYAFYLNQAIARIPQAQIKDGYKPGNGLNLNAGIRYNGLNDVKPVLQLNAKVVQHDTGANADTVSTGGTLVYLSPGAVVTVNERIAVYGFVQLPLYQNVRGVQLTPRYTASLGAKLTF